MFHPHYTKRVLNDCPIIKLDPIKNIRKNLSKECIMLYSTNNNIILMEHIVKSKKYL